ncbi:MAG: purine/cytosine permease [Mycobacterium sp.]|nr:purine/cytosine permease [Mycobacterium sp.]
MSMRSAAALRLGGRYWFTGGWNLGAVIASAVGATFGVLAVNTTLYVGPLADVAGGVDVSTIGSAVLAGVIYLAGAAGPATLKSAGRVSSASPA